MAKRSILIGGFAVASLAAMAWLFLAPDSEPAAKADSADSPSAEPAEKTQAGTAETAPPPAQALAAAASSAVAPAGPPPLNCRQPAGTVLVIGAEAVSAEEFCRDLGQLAGPQPDPVSDGWRQQARQLRQQTIDARLVRLALAAEGAAVDDAAIDAALAERLSGPSGAAVAKLEASSTQLVRAQLRQRLEMNKLLQLRGQAKVQDADLLAAYQADPGRFGEPAAAVALPFLWRLSRSAAEADVKQARSKAGQFLAAVQKGTPAELAIKDTAGQALAKAELVQGAGEAELVAAALQLSPQQWSAPVRTQVGWAVVQVLEVKAGKVLPFDQVRERVRAFVLGRQGLTDRENLLTGLRAAAKVADQVTF
jgi:parvulin-like peptidyl-prolyl isomerase